MINSETIETCTLLLAALECEVAESKTVPEAKNKIAEYKLLFKIMAQI